MRIIRPIDGPDGPILVPYRDNSDFDRFKIQCRAYTYLYEAGIDVRGEYLVQCDDKFGGRTRKAQVRFDLMVFRDRKPLAIIVIKTESSWEGKTRQKERYRQFGVPVIVISGIEDARDIVATVESLR